MGSRAQLEGEFDYDIVDEFLDHFDIMTDTMEPSIIGLQNSDGRKDRIDGLFRIFHNIKSATGFLKLERINLLSALAEEVMETLRDNPDRIDDKIIDWLLLVSDQMRHWYEQIVADENLEETDPRILKIPE